tara:strand:+ start:1644 stop:3125 length:1482 start_codon:yes stop_codon:yes gene_type:complete
MKKIENFQIKSEEVNNYINNKDLVKIDKKKNVYNINSFYINDIIKENRLDVFYKVLYLKLKKINKNLANKIYFESIKLLTIDTFKENEKKSFDDFLNEFEKLNDKLSHNSNLNYCIPISENNSIADGSHRLSILINNNYGDKVNCIKFNIKPLDYNYKFFKKLNSNKNVLEMAVLEFLKFKKNVKIAIIWPSSKLSDENIFKFFDNIIYIKNLKLNENGRLNLINTVYSEEQWLGDDSNNFKGSRTKISSCFSNNGEVKIVYLFEKEKKLLVTKKKIRDFCNIGKNSIHTIDSIDKIKEMSYFTLNEECELFLNNSKFFQKKLTQHKFKTIENFILNNKINNEDILVTSSYILELFGLRDSEDIDYLSNKKLKKNKSIKSHNNQLIFYNKNINDLIYNNQNFFYFKNIKFISLQNLLIFKNNRMESKDKVDSELINRLMLEIDKDDKLNLTSNLTKLFIIRIYYGMRLNFVKFTKRIGIYFFLKKLLIKYYEK